MKRKTFLLGWLLLAIPAAVQAQFDYAVTNQTVTITAYTGASLHVVIPKTINGLPVTSIGTAASFSGRILSLTIPDSVTNIAGGAFYYCASLTNIMVDPLNSAYSSVDGILFNQPQTTRVTYPSGKLGGYTIPNSVTGIGGYAFNVCSGLTSITIPNSVTNIGDHAFYYCTNLTNLTLGSGVTSIGYGAFGGCSSLTNIAVDPLNSAFSSVDGVLFNQPQTILVAYSGGKVGGYTILDSVTSIDDYAFAGCTNLSSVTIPGTVTSIGDSAFSTCFSLRSVTVPNSVTNVGDGAFSGCWGLTNVMIANSVTSIGWGAFRDCSSLTSVTIPTSVTSIGSYAFQQCAGLSSVTIPNSVTSIGDSAFSDCFSLSSVTIPDSVTSIGEFAFAGCSSLANVILGSGVTSIGDRAFGWAWWNLIPNNSLTNITVDLLNPAYRSVEGVLFNQNQTILVQYPAGKLGGYMIPNGVASIRNFAFESCTNLTSVTIPNGVTNIEDDAFDRCTSLTKVTFGSGITSIGYAAFAGCTGLGSVTIPNRVTYIADRAFDYCTSLTNVTLGSSVTSIGGYAFEYCTNLTSVTIPNSATKIGDGAFYYCASLTNVTFGTGVTSIGGGAFSECYGLTSVYFQANAPSAVGGGVFDLDPATIYYLPGTTGWGSTFAGRPTALWRLPYPLILARSSPSFGVQTNQFGFAVSWANNRTVVVEAASDLANPLWSPVQTNTLASGSFYFSDPLWTNYTARFYRIRSQ